MERIGGLAVGIAGHLREAVVSLSPDGRVEWANAAALRLLGLDRDQLVGHSALDRVHPEELDRALAGIGFSTNHPDRTAVVPFRIQRGDGTWADVELMSSVVPGDDGDHLILVLRDAAPRRGVAEALASVATGRPVADTARSLSRVIEARWPGTRAGVLLDSRSGRELLSAEPWPPPLAAIVLADEHAELWRAATGTSQVVVHDEADLPPAVRDVAVALGYRALGVAPADDSGGGAAALVAWFDLPAAADMEFEHASLELRELLGLALERRHHLDQLARSARQDGLTGLLNRTGFVELATGLVADRAALLYVDLDGFKPVNDRHGHAVGDAVLRVVAGRLTSLAGTWDVARIGGDEFVLLGAGADVEEVAADLAAAVVAAVTEPIEVPVAEGDLVAVQIGASVGVAVASAGGATGVDDLLELADGAMYRVKAAGGRGWSLRVP